MPDLGVSRYVVWVCCGCEDCQPLDGSEPSQFPCRNPTSSDGAAVILAADYDRVAVERDRLQRDVLNSVRAGSELRTMLRVAAGDVQRIDALLSPGMRAGTAEAKDRLKHLLTNIRDALDAEQ